MPSSSPITRWVDVSFAVVETPETEAADQRNNNNNDDETNEKDSGSEATFDDMPPLTDMHVRTETLFMDTRGSSGVSALLPTAAATGSTTIDSVLPGNETLLRQEETAAAATSPSRKRKSTVAPTTPSMILGACGKNNDDDEEGGDDDDDYTDTAIYVGNLSGVQPNIHYHRGTFSRDWNDDDDDNYEDDEDDEDESKDYFDEHEDYDSDFVEEEDDEMQDLIMFHLGRMMADMPNYNSEESNDDEEEEGTDFYDVYNGVTTGTEQRNPCTCPQCIIDRIIGCRRCCDEGLDSDDDDHHDHDTKKDDNSNHDNNDDDDTTLDCSASPCAICMEPETRKRRFSYLPCCSRSRVKPLTTADTSSTRFCHKCLVKYLIRCGWGVHRTPETNNIEWSTTASTDDNKNDNDNNYATNNNAEAQLMGECPRCKKLLVLEEFLPPDEKHDDELNLEHGASRQLRQRRNKIAYYNRTRAAIPSTEAIFWYIANRFNGDNDNRFGDYGGPDSSSSIHFRIHLVTLTTCPNPYYIPEELLLDNYGSAERIRLLCQWGLISKRKDVGVTNTNEKPNTTNTRKRMHAVLQQLWQQHGPVENCFWLNASILAVLKCVRESPIYRVYRQIAEARGNLPNRAGAVYQIDPTIQHQLRRLAVRHLQLNDIDDDEKNTNENQNQNEPGVNSDGSCVVRLLPPRGDTDADAQEMETFCEVNGRNHSFMGACNCLSSALMAASRFRILRSLALFRWGFSLFLLSSKHLGLPSLISWPSPLTNHIRIPKNNNTDTTNTNNNNNYCSNKSNIRWRWYAMDGLNLVLGLLLLQILMQVVWVGICLVKAYLLCHVVGSWLDLGRQQSRQKQLGEARIDAGKDRQDFFLNGKRAISAGILAMYVGWKVYPGYYYE